MTLAAGTRLGPYEILAPIGAGGMGEVYKARDTRLGRDVAVKALAARFAADDEMRARFEREARTISQISHPNICAIFDVGSHEGTSYLVMELLEGESLADRLARGPLALSQALRIGKEVCAALSAAHRKGVVHRDLKPANIFLSNAGTKLLDFGLAKLRERVEAGEVSQLRTEEASPLTGKGTVLGTLAYMAPEQLEGRPADARTDLFAFGSVLFEMVTGKRPFTGDTSTAVITSILTGEPPTVSAFRPLSPSALDRAVRTCLAKDPEERWQSATDLGRELEWIESEGSVARGESSAARGRPAAVRAAPRWLPWLVAGIAAASTIALLLRPGRPQGPPTQVVRFDVPPPPGLAFLSSVETTVLAVSPDGSRIAFVATGTPRAGPSPTGNTEKGSERSIWIRDLSDLQARPVAGTDGASSVFWSPDGQSLGFFTPGKLKRIDLGTSTAVTVCDVPVGGGRSGTWGAGGDILFVNIQAANISRVPASGGTPETLVQADASRGEIRIPWVCYLPDGARFLYVVRLRDGTGRLLLSERGGEPRPLMSMFSTVQYCNPGYVLFCQDGVLLARRFDGQSGRLTGETLPVAGHVAYFLSSGRASFAVSANGTLAYQSHESVSHIAWIDWSGREISTVGPPGNYMNLSLSRDGRRVLYDKREPGIGTFDVWSFDLDRNVETRITSSPDTEVNARELPDRLSIVYSATRTGQPQLYRLDLASGREVGLAPGEGTFQWAEDISPDGKTLVYTERTAATPFNIWAAPLSGAGKPAPLLQSRFNKSEVRFSPDGRFLSFISDESGRPEVYVMPYPGPGEKSRVSTGGARLARWSRDGRELFYLSADLRLMAVPIQTSASLRIGAAREVFKLPGKPWSSFDPAPDGKRFLAVVPDVVAGEQPLTVVVNWRAEAQR